MVFPRHLTVEEIKELAGHAREKKMSTECFVLNVICPYIDGLCTFQHLVEESLGFTKATSLACRASYKATALGKESDEKKRIAEGHASLWSNSIMRDCGLCAIPFFKKFEVDSVKIAGRAHSLEKKLSDVKAVKQAIELTNSNASKERFRELYFELFHNKCDYKNCYYAGVGFE
jgi:collagenase-like PrtC family protease